MDLIKTLTANYMKPELPQMNVGDTVRVTLRVKEGSRERNQVFEGTIIARKHGGINETITVRRISYGVGCDKVFPSFSQHRLRGEPSGAAKSVGEAVLAAQTAWARLRRSRASSTEVRRIGKRTLIEASFSLLLTNCIM